MTTAHPSLPAAALIRHYAVNLADVSANGCRVEAAIQLEPGMIGVLEVHLDGTTCSEVFRIVRIERRELPSPGWHLGLEFLPVGPAGPSSLRGAIGRIGPASIARITLTA